MTLLTVDQIHFSYDDKKVLNDINLELHAGSLVGLIGPNGAGKTTLLRLLMAMAKPCAGNVFINKFPIQKFKRRDLARLITLVPQDSQINQAFSVQEIVAMGRNPWLGRFQPPGDSDLALMHAAMTETDTQIFATRPINTLSGGERQRVLIARAIVQQTPIILLDEATANLDICHQLEVLELARQLARKGHLVIAAIHDLNMAARFCDRLLLVAEQRLCADGPPANVITAHHLLRYFHLDAQVTSYHLKGDQSLLITPVGPVKKNHSVTNPLQTRTA